MATLGNFIGNVGFYNKNGELAVELPCYEIVRNSTDEDLAVATENNHLGRIGILGSEVLAALLAAGCAGGKYSSITFENTARTPMNASDTRSIGIWYRNSDHIQMLVFDSGTKLDSIYTTTADTDISFILMGKDILTGTYHLMRVWTESYSDYMDISTILTEGYSNTTNVTSVTFTSTVNPPTAETPDPKSMLTGWLVGRRIAKQRAKGVTA